MIKFITNKKGEPQLDKFGKRLAVGQAVLVMDTIYSKGGRGSVSTGHVIGFDRYCVVSVGDNDPRDVQSYLQYLEDKGHKTWKYDWQELERRGLQNLRIEKVSACYLIGCSEEVKRGWDDGSLFD